MILFRLSHACWLKRHTMKIRISLSLSLSPNPFSILILYVCFFFFFRQSEFGISRKFSLILHLVNLHIIFCFFFRFSRDPNSCTITHIIILAFDSICFDRKKSIFGNWIGSDESSKSLLLFPLTLTAQWEIIYSFAYHSFGNIIKKCNSFFFSFFFPSRPSPICTEL